jgi:opacity protein-like surface antigen
MRTTGLFFILILLLAGVAGAQASASTSSPANVFVGYSYFNTNISPIDRISTNGWEATLEAKAYRWIGMVGDIDTHYGSEGFQICQVFPNSGRVCNPYTADIIERNFMGGPRVSFPIGNLRPFAQVLAGYAHVNAGPFAGTDNSFAVALGAGVDYNVTRRFAWRVQADYLRTQFFGARQDNARASTGLVLRF